MRVLIVGSNDPYNVSGGRYHAMMLACAVANLGWEAHFITDNRPAFLDDLEPLARGRLKLHVSPSFGGQFSVDSFDWVLVIPTGIFLPEFYEACLELARSSRARVGLVNFEAATWFNAMAPEPRDPRLWDYWRRVCVEGGLILSSARESDRWARGFYSAPAGEIRFEVWQPPVNSFAARRFDELEKDGSIVAFVRPQDAHKGAGLLTDLDPALFRDRTLNLISGREVPAAFRAAVTKHLSATKNARVSFHRRINDQHKFRLLTAAQALLFPSRFEGYGYPPVEAAYSGTESVVFPLPVLRETVGSIAHFAPTPDAEGFQSAMAAALSSPERRVKLRQAVFEIGDFARCALRLGDILIRSADRIAPLSPGRFRATMGPFAKTSPIAPGKVDRTAPLPPFPPYIVAACVTTGGELLLTIRAWLSVEVTALEASIAGSTAPVVMAWDFASKGNGEAREMRLYLLAPEGSVGQRILVTAGSRIEAQGLPIEVRVDRAEDAHQLRPVISGVSQDQVEPSGYRRIRAWILARERLNEILLSSNGKSWLAIAIDRERSDIGSKYPAYGTARCEFVSELPANPELLRDRALIFCLSGSGGSKKAVDVLAGWPPAPKAYFTTGAGEGSRDAKPPEIPRPAASTNVVQAKPRRPQLGRLDLADLTDATWKGGIARMGGPGRLAAIAVSKDVKVDAVEPGGVLRFASGHVRRIVEISPQKAFSVLVLDGPLQPEGNGYPRKIDVYDPDWTPSLERSFVLFPWIDKRWWRGVWNVRDRRFRCGFTIKTTEAQAAGLVVGAILRFAASGDRHIQALDESGKDTRVWLNGPIRPLADMHPRSIAVIATVSEDDSGFDFGFVDEAKNAILMDPTQAAMVKRGGLLKFGHDTLARVLAVLSMGDRTAVMLDRRLLAVVQTGAAKALPVDEVDYPEGCLAPYRFPGSDLRAKDPVFRLLAYEAVRRGSALYAAKATNNVQRRALVVSSVSPCPANQGNRVVTRNLIHHLVDLGFQCDVVVQNHANAAETADEFGSAARFFTISYPKWEDSAATTLRKSIFDAVRRLEANRLEAEVAGEIDLASARYHPYFIVRNETVEMARNLYALHAYEAVIINYTHMIRVAEELQDIRPLPPTAVITHDALSRLPREFAGRKLDLMYRPCSAAVERDVLNAVADAVVVAISKNEAEYFQAIGVENPIVVTEYDAAEEMAPHVVSDAAFDAQKLIFHGSANPMNVAGLDWFIDECWEDVLAKLPDARLIVCGRVGTAWNPGLPGIEIVGEVSREKMIELCASSSIAINPCVAGTGLKIKTVETAALGLPAVCLPTAVDGLEEIADRFAIVADDGAGFVAGCIALLTDRERWRGLRSSALEVATQRFRAGQVYKALDEAMGWKHPRPPSPSQDLGTADDEAMPDIDNPVAVLEEEPDNEAAQFALGKSLARSGRSDIGWPMVDQVASARRGDCRAAAEAAEIALQIGAPWRAATYAARLIGQRPTTPRGYLLMGRALLACNLPGEAAAALEQGLMVAPFDGPAQRLLAEALTRAERPEEAERWRARPALGLSLGQYLTLRPSLPGLSFRGFEVDGDDALALRSGEASLLIPEPLDMARRLSVALDIACPKELGADVELEFSLETARRDCLLRARGPGVQTLTIEAQSDVFAAGVARLGLRIRSDATLDRPLRLIGFVIDG